MPWTKPYGPPHNVRLDPAAYEVQGQVCFVTIRAHGESRPFTVPEVNQAVLDALEAEQSASGCAVYS
jgi:hypothetical protein